MYIYIYRKKKKKEERINNVLSGINLCRDSVPVFGDRFLGGGNNVIKRY